MVSRECVNDVINKRGFYAPHISTPNGFAAIPKELLNEIKVGDEVVIFRSEDLSYGGFMALVIETPTMSLNFNK